MSVGRAGAGRYTLLIVRLPAPHTVYYNYQQFDSRVATKRSVVTETTLVVHVIWVNTMLHQYDATVILLVEAILPHHYNISRPRYYNLHAISHIGLLPVIRSYMQHSQQYKI